MKLLWERQPVFVGGCVKRGEGSSFRAMAHAHTRPGDEYQGWICVRGRGANRVGVYVLNSGLAPYDGEVVKPSRLLWHELAHILTGHGHDETWRRKMRELNQPLPKRYRARQGS